MDETRDWELLSKEHKLQEEYRLRFRDALVHVEDYETDAGVRKIRVMVQTWDCTLKTWVVLKPKKLTELRSQFNGEWVA